MSKKRRNKLNSDDVDISELIDGWWNYRKIILFSTILIGLLSTFLLILSNNINSNQKQEYISTVVKGDLGEQNNKIIAAYRSPEYIQEALTITSLGVSNNQILKNMVVVGEKDPLSSNLKDRISSLSEQDLKKFALSNEELEKLILKLNNISNDLISINFYYKDLNVSPQQIINFINTLTEIINNKIILRVSREKIQDLSFINISNINNTYNDVELISRLTGIISVMQDNLSAMKRKHKDNLINVDLNYLSNSTNDTQKILYEFSKNKGNYFAIDTLNLKIDNKNRNIDDFKNTLVYLNKDYYSKGKNLQDGNNQNSPDLNATSTQFDGVVFEKLLSIGGELSLNNFRLQTIKKIQELQVERNSLLGQKDLLNLESDNNNFAEISLDQIIERVEVLANETNAAINQVLSFTQPKVAVKFISTPELIQLNSKPIKEYIKVVLILSVLGFFIVSIIAILYSNKKS